MMKMRKAVKKGKKKRKKQLKKKQKKSHKKRNKNNNNIKKLKITVKVKRVKSIMKTTMLKIKARRHKNRMCMLNRNLMYLKKLWINIYMMHL